MKLVQGLAEPGFSQYMGPRPAHLITGCAVHSQRVAVVEEAAFPGAVGTGTL